jgi:hypothetical protein
MASNIKDFEISKTFNNVILTDVTGSPDTDGIPVALIPSRRQGNELLRNQARLQDGFGTQAPLVLGKNLIEVESTPSSANSVIRRCDLIAMAARQQIQSLIWS